MLETFQGVKGFLLGGSGDDSGKPKIVATRGRLPDTVSIVIHKCTDLYKPTVAAKLKMDPYVAVYLTSKKAQRVQTQPKAFGGANPTFEANLLLPFTGEPMLIIQVFAKELIRDEFIGEVPLDLLPVVNSKTRKWSGPVTIYGQRGTAMRGVVHVTLSLRGGDPFDPNYRAVLAEPQRQKFEDPYGYSAPRPRRPQNTWCC